MSHPSNNNNANSNNNNNNIAPTSFNFQHMNDVIQTKENELKNMLYQRTIQLENYIKNREELLLETTTKYEALKEDFDYNLSLIEARDYEIQRLEKNVEDEKKKKMDVETKHRKVTQENQLLLQKEIELNHRLDQEKQSHKVSKKLSRLISPPPHHHHHYLSHRS